MALTPRSAPLRGHGVARVQVGGRLVYSTCTFNPIEDEAVVAAVLLATKGAMRLLDVSADLPKLKRLPGLSTWKARRTPPQPPP